MNERFEFNLWLVLAHSVVWESQNTERGAGIPAGWFRNDFSPSTPPPRNPGAEAAGVTRAGLEAETGTGEFAGLGPRSDIEAKYRPKYAQIDLDIARETLPGILSLAEEAAPRVGAIEQAGRRAGIEGDLSNVREFGPQYRQALMAANPEQTALRNSLVSDAAAGLNSPGLTDFESRQLRESYRDANRGRFGNTGETGAAQEAFYMMDRARELMDQKRSNAYRAVGLDQQLYGDTFLQSTRRPGGVNPQGYVAQAAGFNNGPITTSPNAANFFDAYNTNFNAEAASNIAGANNDAGVVGSALSY